MISIQKKITCIPQIVFITQMFWFAPLQRKIQEVFFDHYPPGKMSMWALMTA